MQAQAAESSGYAEEPLPLFELQRVRKAGKGRAIAKRRRIPLLKRVNPTCGNHSRGKVGGCRSTSSGETPYRHPLD
jgi:hypothetical protein